MISLLYSTSHGHGHTGNASLTVSCDLCTITKNLIHVRRYPFSATFFSATFFAISFMLTVPHKARTDSSLLTLLSVLCNLHPVTKKLLPCCRYTSLSMQSLFSNEIQLGSSQTQNCQWQNCNDRISTKVPMVKILQSYLDNLPLSKLFSPLLKIFAIVESSFSVGEIENNISPMAKTFLTMVKIFRQWRK